VRTPGNAGESEGALPDLYCRKRSVVQHGAWLPKDRPQAARLSKTMIALSGQANHFVHAPNKDFRESRMREIRTSGLKRGEAMLPVWHTAIEARMGNQDTDL